LCVRQYVEMLVERVVDIAKRLTNTTRERETGYNHALDPIRSDVQCTPTLPIELASQR